MTWTRRSFLEAVGRAGGAAAAYETMVALGLLRVPNAFAGRPALPPDFGRGKKVLILGAGISGLTAAYELRKAGDQVSHISGWQEGAIRSALHVVERIAQPALIAADVTEPATKLKAMAAPRAKAPSIQRRTRGLP